MKLGQRAIPHAIARVRFEVEIIFRCRRDSGKVSDLTLEFQLGVLGESGIRAIMQGDTAGRMREHLAWSGAGFEILVREDDAARARDVLTSPVEIDESAEADSQADDDSFPPCADLAFLRARVVPAPAVRSTPNQLRLR